MSFRYQKLTLYAERNQVKVFEGIDPLTGLPVLIYEFQGDAHPNLNQLESQNIPGLLDTHVETGITTVVVAFSKKYKALSHPLRIGKINILLDSARALRDAAETGVAHGDIRPQRFLASQDHTLLEGFGIPWATSDGPYRAPDAQAEASLAADVYAWAKSILDITQKDLPAPFMNVIERCLAPLANDRPSAQTLYDDLNQVSTAQTPTPAHTYRPPSLDSFDDFEFPTEEPTQPQKPVSTPSPQTPSIKTTKPTLADLQAQEKEEAEQAKAAKQTFIKDLPPGATYKAGETILSKKSSSKAKFDDALIDFAQEPDGRSRRRSILLWTTLICSLLLAAIAFYYQLFSADSFTPTNSNPAEVTQYIVELDISPNNLPPIEVIVVSSPDGSSRPNNSVLGQYPPGRNQVALNQAGLWQLQGRFDGRSSEIVSLELPEQRRAVISIPEKEVEEQP